MIQARFRIDRDDFTLDVDLHIPAQGVTSIFGPSGCGKTTLLRAIAGLEKHRGGFLKVAETIWQENQHFVPPHQRALGYVFQEASLFAHLSVQANLDYGIKRTTKAKSRFSVTHIIELLGIERLVNRKPNTLSGGERQRVAIARALAVNPRLLLMDEPLTSLDLARKQEILPYLVSLRDELDIPVIYVSHSPDEVAQLADHLVLLEAGQVKATGNVQELLTRLDLPLAQGNDAEALIEATVADHDEEYHLSYLDFAGGRFTVTRKQLAIGSKVRLRIAARDVSLSLQLQTGTSILNIFSATIDELKPEGEAQMIVRLMVGDAPLLARVTRKSATLLNLKPGMMVYAQAKSVALLS